MRSTFIMRPRAVPDDVLRLPRPAYKSAVWRRLCGGAVPCVSHDAGAWL